MNPRAVTHPSLLAISTRHLMNEAISSPTQHTLHVHSNKIKTWWKKYTQIHTLRKIRDCVKSSLTPDDLQHLSNTCNEITNICKGDGAGLLGGALTDMLLSKYFAEKIDHYVESRSGESDMRIYETDLSLKKINGKSTIALNWSKNKMPDPSRVLKPYFTSHIMIINLRTQTWWKTTPKTCRHHTKPVKYTDEIKSGIYLVDKQYCKLRTLLSSNNKTNTLIQSTYLYHMLQRSVRLNMWVELPAPNKNIKFNILHAFSE